MRGRLIPAPSSRVSRLEPHGGRGPIPAAFRPRPGKRKRKAGPGCAPAPGCPPQAAPLVKGKRQKAKAGGVPRGREAGRGAEAVGPRGLLQRALGRRVWGYMDLYREVSSQALCASGFGNLLGCPNAPFFGDVKCPLQRGTNHLDDLGSETHFAPSRSVAAPSSPGGGTARLWVRSF